MALQLMTTPAKQTARSLVLVPMPKHRRLGQSCQDESSIRSPVPLIRFQQEGQILLDSHGCDSSTKSGMVPVAFLQPDMGSILQHEDLRANLEQLACNNLLTFL